MANLKKQVTKQLDRLELNYNVNKKKYRFELDIPAKNGLVQTNLYYDEEQNGIYNLSCFTFNLPKERTTEVLHKINEIHNKSFSLAHLYIDDKNWLGAQSVIYISKNRIDEDVFKKFLFAPIWMLDYSYDEIKIAF